MSDKLEDYIQKQENKYKELEESIIENNIKENDKLRDVTGPPPKVSSLGAELENQKWNMKHKIDNLKLDQIIRAQNKEFDIIRAKNKEFDKESSKAISETNATYDENAVTKSTKLDEVLSKPKKVTKEKITNNALTSKARNTALEIAKQKLKSNQSKVTRNIQNDKPVKDNIEILNISREGGR